MKTEEQIKKEIRGIEDEKDNMLRFSYEYMEAEHYIKALKWVIK
jgi:hypothetical protein